MREITIKLLDLVDEGMLTWEQIAMSALGYMSEDDVAGMARVNELIPEDDDEEDEEDDIDVLLNEVDDEDEEGDDDEFLRVLADEMAETAELAQRYAEADAVDAALARMLRARLLEDEAGAALAAVDRLLEIEAAAYKASCDADAADYAKTWANEYTPESGDYFVNWKANYANAYTRRLQELQK